MLHDSVARVHFVLGYITSKDVGHASSIMSTINLDFSFLGESFPEQKPRILPYKKRFPQAPEAGPSKHTSLATGHEGSSALAAPSEISVKQPQQERRA